MSEDRRQQYLNQWEIFELKSINKNEKIHQQFDFGLNKWVPKKLDKKTGLIQKYRIISMYQIELSLLNINSQMQIIIKFPICI